MKIPLRFQSLFEWMATNRKFSLRRQHLCVCGKVSCPKESAVPPPLTFRFPQFFFLFFSVIDWRVTTHKCSHQNVPNQQFLNMHFQFSHKCTENLLITDHKCLDENCRKLPRYRNTISSIPLTTSFRIIRKDIEHLSVNFTVIKGWNTLEHHLDRDIRPLKVFLLIGASFLSFHFI